MISSSRFLLIVAFPFVMLTSASGQPPAFQRPTLYWPTGVEFDASIDSPKKFFGFEIGHRHLRHDQVVSYMRYLATASDRVQLNQYGKTHGGRPLLLLTITSPANHQRIEQIRRSHRQLTKPPRSHQVDIQDLPVVMNMGYGVHGDESSATNTSPLVAHYLAAARGADVERTLDQCVILLDPSLNPDGFDRFARWANTFRGRVPNPDPVHIEHNQGWPSGRVNYYWFDLNRDWLPLQHPESRGRIRWYHAWKPNIVLDFHEMGTNSTFFFQPGIPQRRNPLTPPENVELTGEIAKYHAKDLDQIGSLYFTQEVFDDFYMGKGSTYPDLHGSIGILFEQGSSRGHIQESQNGVIRFTDTIRNQFTASLSSLRAATEMREKLITYKRDFYEESWQLARRHPVKTYVFQAAANRTRLQSFADILLRHDIRCYWLTEPVGIGDRNIVAGSLVVPAEQAEFRFLRSLLERRKQFQENVFYDVSAWTLPLAFNLKQIGLRTTIDPNQLQACKIGQRRATDISLPQPDESPVAYFVDWRDDAAPRMLQRLLAADATVKVARKPLSAVSDGQSKSFSFGTISIPMGLNKGRQTRRRIHQILRQSAGNGVSIAHIDSGLAESGIDLGSNNFPTVSKRSVAMIVGRGISAYQAGQVWHQLDARTGLPVSMFNQDRLGSADLDRYNTLIMVSGSYDLSTTGFNELKRWIERGGTLITIGSATAYAENRILELEQAEALDATNMMPEEDPERPRFVDAQSQAALARVSGTIFQTEIDTSHPLLYGFESKNLPVFRGSTSVLQDARPEISNPARYASDPLLAGYASQENQQKIARSPALTVHSLGRGRVILMIDDPNFRAFWPATSRVFLNAVFFGELASAGGGRR